MRLIPQSKIRLEKFAQRGNPRTQRQLLQAGKPVQRTGSTFRKI